MKMMTGQAYAGELRDRRLHNEEDEAINETVLKIIQEVKKRGDAALIDYTAQFDVIQLFLQDSFTFYKTCFRIWDMSFTFL